MTIPGRVLCVDYGSTRIGIALTDPFRVISKPYLIITHRNAHDDMQSIVKIAHEQQVTKIVIGLPTNSTGGLSSQANRIVRWARKLSRLAPCPIVMWDESYSSILAQKIVNANGSSRRRARHAGQIDDVAAATILADYLEAGGAFAEPGQPLEAYGAHTTS